MPRSTTHAPDVLVLCYHAVSEHWPADLAVTPKAFEAQLRTLVDQGRRSLTFADAVLSPPSEKTVVVTFDDGYRSTLDIAWPIMRRMGMVGTVFVPTAFPDSGRLLVWPGVERWVGTPHESELRALTWEALKELDSAGWEIGSHTCLHPRLPDMDDTRLREELVTSKEQIESQLGMPARSVAYPYGDVDHRVAEAARAAGYEVGAALSHGADRKDPMRRPRTGIYRNDSMRRYRVKISAGTRALYEAPLGVMASDLRRRVRSGRRLHRHE